MKNLILSLLVFLSIQGFSQPVYDKLTFNNGTGMAGLMYYEPNYATRSDFAASEFLYERSYCTNADVSKTPYKYDIFIVKGWNWLGHLTQAKELGIRTVVSTQGSFGWKNTEGSSLKAPPLGDDEDMNDEASYLAAGYHAMLWAYFGGKNPNVDNFDPGEIRQLVNNSGGWTGDCYGGREFVDHSDLTPGRGFLDVIQGGNEIFWPKGWSNTKRAMTSEGIATYIHVVHGLVRKADSLIEFWGPSTLDLEPQLYLDVNQKHIEKYGKPIPIDIVWDFHEYLSYYNRWWGTRLGGVSPMLWKNPKDKDLPVQGNVYDFVKELIEMVPVGTQIAFSETAGYSHDPESVLYLEAPGYTQYESKAIYDVQMMVILSCYPYNRGTQGWQKREGDGGDKKDNKCGQMEKIPGGNSNDHDGDGRPDYRWVDQSGGMMAVYHEMWDAVGPYEYLGEMISEDPPYVVQFKNGNKTTHAVFTDGETLNYSWQDKNYQVDARMTWIEFDNNDTIIIDTVVVLPDTVVVGGDSCLVIIFDTLWTNDTVTVLTHETVFDTTIVFVFDTIGTGCDFTQLLQGQEAIKDLIEDHEVNITVE